jgi:hypothetical protein
LIPPIYDESEFPLRLRQLLALEMSRIVEDLDARRDMLIEVWGRHRDRSPFIDTVHTRWRTVGLPDLATLPTDVLVAVESFYRELDDLTLYFRFTQDMPTTLADAYDDGLRRLSAYAALALEALGGAPKRPLVEFDDEVDDEVLVDVSVAPHDEPA